MGANQTQNQSHGPKNHESEKNGEVFSNSELLVGKLLLVMLLHVMGISGRPQQQKQLIKSGLPCVQAGTGCRTQKQDGLEEV